jgi:hypothetical protein
MDPGVGKDGAENLAPTGIRYPDRSARSQSLYRLSYPGPILLMCEKILSLQRVTRRTFPE